MKVYGTFVEKVTINPKDVITSLINDALGKDGWIFKEDGKLFRGFELSRTLDGKEEITEELYEYVKALQLVNKRLKDE